MVYNVSFIDRDGHAKNEMFGHPKRFTDLERAHKESATYLCTILNGRLSPEESEDVSILAMSQISALDKGNGAYHMCHVKSAAYHETAIAVTIFYYATRACD